jgi:hypothetical protein
LSVLTGVKDATRNLVYYFLTFAVESAAASSARRLDHLDFTSSGSSFQSIVANSCNRPKLRVFPVLSRDFPGMWVLGVPNFELGALVERCFSTTSMTFTHF